MLSLSSLSTTHSPSTSFLTGSGVIMVRVRLMSTVQMNESASSSLESADLQASSKPVLEPLVNVVHSTALISPLRILRVAAELSYITISGW